MTEEEWQASINPRAMVEFLQGATEAVRTRWQGPREARRFAVSERKLRLIACACCTKVVDLLPGDAHRRLLALAKRAAEGPVAAERALAQIQRTNREWRRFREAHAEGDFALRTVGEARLAVLVALQGGPGLGGVFDHAVRAFSPLSSSAIERELAQMADLAREVIGNPFRVEPMVEAWRSADGGVVRRLARAIYDEETYHDLPVLADALQDAGCTSAAMLEHCRSGGPHVRGCWALDRVLGLE